MRAKFGGSGGLGGGMSMGGIGSAPANSSSGYSSGELLSTLGGGLSSAASGLSSAAGTAGWLLSSAKESAKSYVASRRSGAPGEPEEPLSTDLSDLLGGQDRLDEPPQRASPFANASRTSSTGSCVGMPAAAPAAPPPVGDDFFSDKAWGAAPSADASRAAAAETTTLMAEAAAPPPSVHYSGGIGSSTPSRRKVAAVKVKADDAGWDDWGDAGKW